MQHNDPFSDIIPTPTPEDFLFMDHQLAEMQQLARRGDDITLAGAPIIAWWGFCDALAGLWNGLEQVAHFPPVWVAPFNILAGYLGSFLITFFLKSSRVLGQWRSDAISVTWIMMGFCIPVSMIGCYARHVDDVFVMSGFECLLFSVAMGITAMCSQRRWLLAATGGWMLTSLAILFWANDVSRPFIFSFACLAFMVGPGVYLMAIHRREQK